MIQTAGKRDSNYSNNRRNSGLRGVVLGLALSLALGCSITGALASPESDPNLKKLEVKFFQHDYPKDDVNSRLERLEKMVFGESKTGDASSRLSNLVSAVPNLDSVVTEPASSGSGGGGDDNSAPSGDSGQRSRASAPVDKDADIAEREQSISNSSQYPAVSAIEKKLFGKDYASEPIIKRLERLETKSFGSVSQSDDLSERVDRLKMRTGVDVARTPPPGSDWADDDEHSFGGGDLTYHQADTTPYAGQPRVPATNLGGGSGVTGGGGGYGMSDRYAAPRRAAAPPSSDDGLDNFDYSGSSSRAATPSGSYGFNPPRRVASAPPTSSGIPQPAPDFTRGASGGVPPAAMGLNQRLGLLEKEVFAKTFPNETLPARLTRLEETTFPGRKPEANDSLPDRVAQLEAAIQPGRQVAQGKNSLQYDAGDDGMPRPAPQRTGGGLSKIINGIGNLIGGGGYGAYSMGSNLVTDPQTGYLVDMYSGTMIDPRTGMVVGSRGITGGVSPYGTNYGTYSGGGYSGFNNGLSPMGVPFAGSSGMRMGVGGGSSGMRFGTGMMGGGMGFGMSPGMMGVWP